jgi:glycosyltransferase involved in cell wall biosynthesis
MSSFEPERPVFLLVSSNSSGRGGGEKYLVYLTTALRELGATVHALISTAEFMNGWDLELKAAGAVVHRLDLKSLAQRPLRFFQSIMDHAQIRRIARFCRGLGPDGIVVNQQYDEDGLDYLAGALASGCKNVCGVMHLPMTANKHERSFGRFRGIVLRSWYERHPYSLVFVSKGAQREFERYYSVPRPTYVVNSAISSKRRAEPPKRMVWSDDVPAVGFIGQFVPQKNLMFLIKGWVAALRSGSRSRVLLVGDGPQRPELERYLRANAPSESWLITGWIEHPEEYVGNIDLFVLLSHFEGLSLSLLEVASQGIPCLIADFNGAEEVLERAPWVSQTSSTDLTRYVADLRLALSRLNEIKDVSLTQVSQFNDYFSPRRMAFELLKILNLEGYQPLPSIANGSCPASRKSGSRNLNVAILFVNIGYYHYCRLAAAFEACAAKGWKVVGIQVTDSTLEHPWGSIAEGQVPILTLDTRFGSKVAADGKIPAVSQERIHECFRGVIPDVVFLPGWSFKVCRQCLAWCRKRSVPVVLMSESKLDDERRIWLKERLKAAMYVRHFKAAIVGGAIHGAYAESLGIARDRIFTGYDVVDNMHFESGADRSRANPAETRRLFPKVPKSPYFIVASRMVERKNILGLIRAFKGYVDNLKDPLNAWGLVVCGNGPQLEVILKEVSRSKLGRHVHLPGFVPYSEMPAWYGLASAFVHPALQEQWGLVVNEACAAGLPVIVSKTTGASYDLVVDGKNGFLIDPTDIDDIAEKLSLIHYSSKETLKQMGDYSRRLAQKLAPERFGEGVVKAVLSLQGRNV